MNPLQPLTSVTSPSFVAPTRSFSRASLVSNEVHALPTDRAQLSELQLPTVTARPETGASPQPEAPAQAVLPPPPPTRLQMEEAHPPEEDMLKFVLDASSGSSMRDHPRLLDIRQRLPQLPAPIAQAGLDPLLEALTADHPQKLDSFHDTMTWARKHKAEARELLGQGGDWGSLEAAAARARLQDEQPANSLERAIGSPGFLKAYPLGHNHQAEACRLIDQLEAGNDNPGLGTKTLGKGVCYLRGREGSRIFYRMQDDRPQYLIVCNKSSEESAINILRYEYDLR